MRAAIALITVTFITACGADGEPIRPTKKTSELTTSRTSVTISGTARIGVSWEG